MQVPFEGRKQLRLFVSRTAVDPQCSEGQGYTPALFYLLVNKQNINQ
jgi:hypothetical protein